MKLLIIGAGGTVGSIITPELAREHEVITAGRHSGDINVDISSTVSIHHLFNEIGNVDAVICVAGDSDSTDISRMTREKFSIGIEQKLLGQINLVMVGIDYLNDGGSFTLISGKMGEKPARGSSGKAIVNGAINSFVLAASLEMPNSVRINAISPSKVADIAEEKLIGAYLKSITSLCNGEIITIGYN